LYRKSDGKITIVLASVTTSAARRWELNEKIIFKEQLLKSGNYDFGILLGYFTRPPKTVPID
jgi:hypothetical protein